MRGGSARRLGNYQSSPLIEPIPISINNNSMSRLPSAAFNLSPTNHNNNDALKTSLVIEQDMMEAGSLRSTDVFSSNDAISPSHLAKAPKLNEKSANAPCSSSESVLQEWVAFFGREANDYIQTTTRPCMEAFKLWIKHAFNDWAASDRRRFVVANPPSALAKAPAFETTPYFPQNVVNNRRYSIFSFWWLCLIDQFRFSAFNIYFLALACSQFVPVLQVGMMFTYFAPLAFVVALSMLKEGYDDIKRWQQDRSINSAEYQRLVPGSKTGEFETLTAEQIKVGDIIKVEAGKRIPADLILLHTTETTGSCFVTTSQLDGEVDLKPRAPIKATSKMSTAKIAQTNLVVEVEVPHRDIYEFEATYVVVPNSGKGGEDALKVGVDVNSTLWSGCSVAAGTTLGLVIFTGIDTRITLNAERAQTKVSLMDRELNFISLLCFGILFILSILLVVQQLSIHSLPIGRIFISMFRFQILMSAIIPISLRVNLDIARIWYAIGMVRDKLKLPGVAVRNTNIPEELGRLHYLFSDKTGTLTKNEMHFRTLHLDDNFALEDSEIDDIKMALDSYFLQLDEQKQNYSLENGASPKSTSQGTSSAGLDKKPNFSDAAASSAAPPERKKHANLVGYNKKQSILIGRAILSLALCHQVTPVEDEETPGKFTLQAASPDEIAMVSFASTCGIQLLKRETFRKEDEETGDIIEGEFVLNVLSSDGSGAETILRYDILRAFPFSSERKCMSIVVRNQETRQIQFLMKGADVKMQECIVKNDSTSWLEDRCFELARTGRRTLVFAAKDLPVQEYKIFARALAKASAAPSNRASAIEMAMANVEKNLGLVGVTGVEDLLQDDVVKTLEHLGVCGIKVWMLTGDKVETAKCIGRSTKLIRTDLIETFVAKSEQEADELMDQLCSVYAPNVLAQVRREEAEKARKNRGKTDDLARQQSGLNNNSGRLFDDAGGNTASGLSGIKMSLLSNTNDPHDYGGMDHMNKNPNISRKKQPKLKSNLEEDYDAVGLLGALGGPNNSNSPGVNVAWALVTDGATLKFCLPGPDHPRQRKFLGLTSLAESVVVARCSPTQKAQVVQAMIQYRGPEIRVAAIGDGGNDVSMIRAAHVGIGLEGLEGKQASLAADYSIPKFCECEWLITWHGRCSYLRTASLAQFIIHRGVVYAIVQAVFSLMFNGSTMAVFNGYLMTAYATIYTMAPVFALVLNEDSFESDIEDYPELYRWLLKSRAFNTRSFLQWMWLSFFQGGIMMYMTVKMFSDEMFQIVSIAFTTLILTELFFVATCVSFRILWNQRRLHFFLFFLAEIVSLLVYFASVFVLPETFDVKFFFSDVFWRNVGIIAGCSIVPVAVLIFIDNAIRQWLKNRRTNTVSSHSFF